MTKNISVTDQKPKNTLVADTKPKNSAMAVDFGTEQLFTVVLGAGMWMGFGALTYPEAGTVLSPVTQ